MPKFKPYNYNQSSKVVINYQDQLQSGTFEHATQWCCETNIIFKALACDTVPHFTTIASFVSSHSIEIEALFEQVLLICHEQGLLGSELFAIDGCKMSSNAAKEHSGTNRFSLRSTKKVQGQWSLFCMVHNIEKLANYGQLTA